MKIGILTFHCAYNYGAVLQAYALKNYLSNEGYNVKIINYTPGFLINPYKAFSWRWMDTYNPIKFIHRLLVYLPLVYPKWKRNNQFQRFIDSYLLDGGNDAYAEMDSLDVIIVGSDQVWNTFLTGNDPFFMGNFNHKGRLVAYAPSVGGIKKNDNEIKEMEQILNNFSYVSVRESSTVKLLQSLTDKQVYHVVDPTLLLGKQRWSDLQELSTIQKQPYVFVYQVRKHPGVMPISSNLAQQLDADVIEVKAWVDSFALKKESGFFFSPTDFVNLIRNSACVVTSSFHGVMFSVIFNKPFYFVKLGTSGDDRIMDFLEEVKLGDRAIEIGQTPEFSEVDYSEATSIIEKMRNESIMYLKQSLIS